MYDSPNMNVLGEKRKKEKRTTWDDQDNLDQAMFTHMNNKKSPIILAPLIKTMKQQ